MPTPTYATVLKTVCGYLDGAKADSVLQRHLKRCNATAETFGPAELRSSLDNLLTALTLYVPDAAKRTVLADQIRKVS